MERKIQGKSNLSANKLKSQKLRVATEKSNSFDRTAAHSSIYSSDRNRSKSIRSLDFSLENLYNRRNDGAGDEEEFSGGLQFEEKEVGSQFVPPPALDAMLSSSPPTRSPNDQMRNETQDLLQDLMFDDLEPLPDHRPRDSRGTRDPNNKLDPRRDLTRVAQKMFGLDPMAILSDSSEDEDDGSPSVSSQSHSSGSSVTGHDEGKRNTLKKVKRSAKQRHRKPAKTKLSPERNVATNNNNAGEHVLERSLSPIMPTISDRKFLSKLQQREGRLNKELNDMKHHLEVMNINVEKALKKVSVNSQPSKSNAQNRLKASLNKKPPTVTKKLEAGEVPKEAPSKRLTAFLQSTGGLTGGWTHKDHSTFLSVYHDSNGPRSGKMLQLLTKQLPNKRPRDVIAHLSWYDQYDTLNKSNKAYIRRWLSDKVDENDASGRETPRDQNCQREARNKGKEILQAKREEEREINRERLSHWKISKAQAEMLCGKADAERKTVVDEYLKKHADFNLQNLRKKLDAITAPRRHSSAILEADVESSGASFRRHSLTVTTRSLSGFGGTKNKEMTSDAQNEPNNHSDDRESSGFLPMLDTHQNPSEVKKITLNKLRSRDNKFLRARKEAIETAKNRARKTLTHEEIKQRIKKIDCPSKVMRDTQGWKIRRDILQTERTEAENEKIQRSSLPMTTSGRVMQPVPFVNHIPKLATPQWKSSH